MLLTNDYVLDRFDSSQLTNSIVFTHSAAAIDAEAKGFLDIVPENIAINEGAFTSTFNAPTYPVVKVLLQAQQLILSCGCGSRLGKLCGHQAQVLYNIVNRDELRIFFDEKLRHEKLKKFAADYGLENEPDPDRFFLVEYAHKKIVMKPKMAALLPVTKESLGALEAALFTSPGPSPFRDPTAFTDSTVLCVVIKQHKYYKHLCIELYSAPTTQDGKIKNPLTFFDPLTLVWGNNHHQQIKFFLAITRFQENYNDKRSAADIESLRAIAGNPRGLSFYCHNSDVSEHITAASITPVRVSTWVNHISLTVIRNGDFYELGGQLKIQDQTYALRELQIKYTYFILNGDTLLLVDDLGILDLIDFFKRHPHDVAIHSSRYNDFKRNILSRLEDRVHVSYAYIQSATDAQINKNGFNAPPERIIYLSDSESYVMINPVMKYGPVEIPILSQRQIYAQDDKGNEFAVKRDDAAEVLFTALLKKQHSLFYEQPDDGLLYFYLHKERFLEEEWFLQTFEEWTNQGITVLGFNGIRGNKLNPNKANISIIVTSGINWFNTDINVRFGKKKASLKQLHKSIRNKSKFVQLDDGTLGILPITWFEKLAGYFNAGEIAADLLRTPKINYSVINQLYDHEMLDLGVQQELTLYQAKFNDFDAIREVEVPPALQATLRPYQKQGLNWLNFLDEFNFGGCLADDMGLGKSIQIIAFILSQRKKVTRNTNLLVVPTSLIFNWQEEVRKFAPSIKIHTIYGADRIKDTSAFDDYEIILTSYGTLLSDIGFLRKYTFNYVFLDESQNIKNPSSQRYKAVCLLTARNKIAITGTPVENNTFDLYGQLSFACPGLLGSKHYFKDTYAIPIDKFKDSRRAAELQKKIHPFILRRTKKQVALELPDKTEMVMHCEMPAEQRKVYDACEKELRDFIATKPADDLQKNSMYVLKGLTRLRQICNSPLLLNEGTFYDHSSAKINVLVEQIENKSPQHKILIFSQFVTMLNLVGKELKAKNITFEYLTGSTTNREAVVKAFQDNADVRVFLISLKAGGTGLNLTEADYVYIVDPWWNPAVENQAIDRCYRIGQKKNVIAVRLICPDTIEDKIMKLQESKKELVNELIKTDSAVLKSLSKNDLLALLNFS